MAAPPLGEGWLDATDAMEEDAPLEAFRLVRPVQRAKRAAPAAASMRRRGGGRGPAGDAPLPPPPPLLDGTAKKGASEMRNQPGAWRVTGAWPTHKKSLSHQKRACPSPPPFPHTHTAALLASYPPLHPDETPAWRLARARAGDAVRDALAARMEVRKNGKKMGEQKRARVQAGARPSFSSPPASFSTSHTPSLFTGRHRRRGRARL